MVLRIDTVVEASGPAAAIVLSDEQVEELGGGRRAAVKLTIGDRTARLRLAVRGGRNLLGLSKAARAELGVEIGEAVHAVIEVDTAERTIELPDDFATALDAQPGARTAFDALPPSHRREHVRAILEAKRPETRARRIEAALARLSDPN